MLSQPAFNYGDVSKNHQFGIIMKETQNGEVDNNGSGASKPESVPLCWWHAKQQRDTSSHYGPPSIHCLYSFKYSDALPHYHHS